MCILKDSMLQGQGLKAFYLFCRVTDVFSFWFAEKHYDFVFIEKNL